MASAAAARRDDRLVEAHRRARSARRAGVPEQVVLLQRLLDQQQVEGVERGEVRAGRARVRRRSRRPAAGCRRRTAPARAHRLQVPARLDLQLDPAVALRRRTRRPRPAASSIGRRRGCRPTRRSRPRRASRRGTSPTTARRRAARRRAPPSRARRFAIGWPRTGSSRPGTSPALSSRPVSRGTRWSRSTSSAASLNSWLYSGARSATHSPQPTSPSAVVSRSSSTSFSCSTPNDVRNGRTSGSRHRSTSTDSTLMPASRNQLSHRTTHRQVAVVDRGGPSRDDPPRDVSTRTLSGLHDVVALDRQPGDDSAGHEQRLQHLPYREPPRRRHLGGGRAQPHDVLRERDEHGPTYAHVAG